ncbi:neuropeptide FF receptor 2-like [Exaiptasia diaphana]|uniref:G-protein coupled receptors family 1 profile domain-containing protein n=1 Tax=Exaiptasia diaphana TaxID=2652724 RepID=A0A913Y9J7_EXADI|nr:neuropeptide FF receptor 2-like [Exaiptasia diaphana]
MSIEFNPELFLDVVFSLLLVLNIAGNYLVIYIIYKKQRTSTDYLLLNLALSDMLFGVLIVPKFFKNTIIKRTDNIFENVWMCLLFKKGTLPYTAILSCISTMMAVTLERYFAICHPHSFKKWFSTRRVKMAIVICWLLAIAYYIPYYIKAKCRDVDYEIAQVYSLLSMILAVLELVFLIILSTKIYVSLWLKPTGIHPSASQRELEERKLKKKVTRCVLAVVGSFVLSYIPFFTIQALSKYHILSDNNLFGFSPKKLIDLFLAINAAVDPYLYAFQNTRLRGFLRKLLLCGKTANGQQE